MTSKIIHVEIEVQIRKYEVDKKRLMECLSDHKSMSMAEIAEKLDRPKTLVEHWFRKDKYFAIPDPEDWFSLKKLLGIETDEFDKSITTFETNPGVFDMANRIYIGEIAPTLTTGTEKLYFCLENYETDNNG